MFNDFDYTSDYTSDSEEEQLEECLIVSAVYLSYIKKKQKTLKKREYWVNPFLMERKLKGRFACSFEDMKKYPRSFKENFHMDVETFEELFKLVEPHINFKIKTRPNDFISSKEKFACVLEYLASGSLQRHVASVYRISKQYFGEILDKVCQALCTVLQNEIPKLSMDKFIQISNSFNYIWNIPNTLGAIDGKHIQIKKPNKSGTLFYNYKGFCSIVLMGISDAYYCFTYIDVGALGTEGDANVFNKSKFGIDLLNDELPFPPNSKLNNTDIPYFFIGDDAFPLHKRILKPFKPSKNKKLTKEEAIFNYRLSRGRRCIENAFGIMSRRWMCLSRTILCSPERAQKITTACCYLHNYLMRVSRKTYCPPNFGDSITPNGKIIEGEWRRKVSSFRKGKLQPYRGRAYVSGKENRDLLKEFLNSREGEVRWQKNMI